MEHLIEVKSQRGHVLETHSIYFKIDRPDTLASYVMLTDFYKTQDISSKKAIRFKLIETSRAYLTAIKTKYGRLYCTYCGKPDLVIELEGMRVREHIKATIDHIEAKSKGGDLFNPKNFTCACGKCNNKKSDSDVLTFLGY